MEKTNIQPVYKFEPENLWFTSDTHFCHENIIRFSGRPFRDAAEMNEELIRRWNETVPENGIVFHLGDFCMGNPRDWNDIMCRLHGKIYLILGNHDMKNIKQDFMQHFELVTQQVSIRVGGQTIILNHNPFLCYGGSYRDVWQFFGHVHSGPLSHTGLDHPRLNMLFPLQYDVGVDNNDFRPVSYFEVKAKIEAQVEEARRASGLSDIRGTGSDRRIVFLDPAVAPTSTAQKAAFKRLQDAASDIVEISVGKGQSHKEAIGRRVALHVSMLYGDDDPVCKVVYNAAVSGGLHLSERAIGWLRERGMEFDVESTCKYGPFVDIPRHNPLLVKCIETLGEDANGPENGWTPKAELHVATISGTYYYIDDHDGGGEEVIDITKMTDASE